MVCRCRTRSAEEILEIHQEPTEVEQAPAGLHLHQEVDVASIAGVATSDRPEHPHLAGSRGVNRFRPRVRILVSDAF